MNTLRNLQEVTTKLFDKYYFFSDIADIKDYDQKEVYQIFLTDYQRYFDDPEVDYKRLFTRVELIGILCYRIARWYYIHNNESAACHFSNLGRIISGFEIYYSADIGKGIKINHGMGLVVGARSKIGDNVLLHQNVTLGEKSGRPTLKDNVTVYAGAKILGPVTVGGNAVIGANTVCMIDVPDNRTVVGIPGKLIERHEGY